MAVVLETLIEDDQPHSAKPLICIRSIDYEEGIRVLDFDSLSRRVDKGDLILIYKNFGGFLEGVQEGDRCF